MVLTNVHVWFVQPRITAVELDAIRASGLFERTDSYSINCQTAWIFGKELCLRVKNEHRAFMWRALSLELDGNGKERLRYKFPPTKATGVGVGKTRACEDGLMYSNDVRPLEACPSLQEAGAYSP